MKQQDAEELFASGCNCAQAVLVAFCAECKLDRETAMRLGSSLGGGMGRLREVCGAVSAMFLIAGLLYGESTAGDKDKKDAHYRLIQDLAAEFKAEQGSIICRELLGLPEGKSEPVSEARTAGYYRRRPCKEIVGFAAMMMEKTIREKADEVH